MDPRTVTANAVRAKRLMLELAEHESDAVGFAQGRNQGGRRGATRAPPPRSPGYEIGAEGARDVTAVAEVTGLRQQGNRAFYRHASTWVDAQVKNEAVQEVIARWTPRFYEILLTTKPEENARLAQEGTLVLAVQGRVVQIVDRP